MERGLPLSTYIMRIAVLLSLLAVACSGSIPDDGMAGAKHDTKSPAPPATSGGKTTPSQPTSGDGTGSGGKTPPPPPAADAGAHDSGAQTDAGGTPPSSDPFRELDVRYPVGDGLYLTQCTPDAVTQYVWKTTANGTDAYARFADPAYPQMPNVFGSCGAKTNGAYPIVLTWTADDGTIPQGTFVAKCVATARAEVYQITTAVDGHPAATFAYPENHPACP